MNSATVPAEQAKDPPIALQTESIQSDNRLIENFNTPTTLHVEQSSVTHVDRKLEKLSEILLDSDFSASGDETLLEKDDVQHPTDVKKKLSKKVRFANCAGDILKGKLKIFLCN